MQKYYYLIANMMHKQKSNIVTPKYDNPIKITRLHFDRKIIIS